MARGTTFGEQLRRLREAAGLSQEDLGERAGLTAKAIGALERGERQRPYPQTIRALATALQLDEARRAALIAALPRRGNTEASEPAPAPPPAPTPTPIATRQAELPGYLTDLIGREREAAVVRQLLARPDVRLLTLTGPGGVGKTRLALQAAAEVAAEFPDGIRFAALASLGDPALVLGAIAQALGTPDRGDAPPLATLTAALAEKRALLVLDNFEHLTAAGPDIAALLLACPSLKVLATSQGALRVRGEQEYRVPPLALPGRDDAANVEALGRSAAVRLFVARALAAQPEFALTPENASAVAAICRRLDGLPLAIELAAARVKLFPPTTLLARLERGLGLLAGGPRDLPPRQRTMRDTIAWSYDLLTLAEQTLLRRLAIFAGGWSLESLEAVCSGDGIAESAELELLGGLAERSLVAVEERPDGVRYTLLETVRQYAAEQLAAHGEAQALQARHADHFRALAEAAEPALFSGTDTVPWLGRLEREYDNLRAALLWASEAGAPETGLRTAAALWRFWWIRGHYAEGLHWLGRLRARAAADPEAARYGGVLARATHGAALLAWSQGDHPAVGALAGESLVLAREAGDRRTVAWAIGTLGLVAWAGGEYDRARSLYEESLGIFRALGDRLGIARTLNNLGEEAQARGDWDRALTLYEECLALDRALGNREGMAFRLNNLGQVALHRDQPELAAALLAESLTVFRELGHTLGALMNLAALGAVACEPPTPRFARAARLFGAASAWRDRSGAAQHPPVAESYARQIAAARDSLGAETFAVAWAEGEALTPEQAVGYALRFGDAAGDAVSR